MKARHFEQVARLLDANKIDVDEASSLRSALVSDNPRAVETAQHSIAVISKPPKAYVQSMLDNGYISNQTAEALTRMLTSDSKDMRTEGLRQMKEIAKKYDVSGAWLYG